jgi:hypothetical protein
MGKSQIVHQMGADFDLDVLYDLLAETAGAFFAVCLQDWKRVFACIRQKRGASDRAQGVPRNRETKTFSSEQGNFFSSKS